MSTYEDLRIKALMILSIALIATLFAAGPIFLEHPAFAAHHPLHKGSGDSLQGLGYGPCFRVIAPSD
jgi:hypothetical protein